MIWSKVTARKNIFNEGNKPCCTDVSRVDAFVLSCRALYVASVQKQGNGRCTRYESHFYIYQRFYFKTLYFSEYHRPRSINLYVRMIDSRKQMKIIERETALALIVESSG